MSANVKKLSELKPGEIFVFAGIRWVKLEDSAEGTKVIAADKVEDRTFDTEGRNNWKESTLREYLNSDFLEYLYDEGAKPEDFLTVVSDLTSDDGLKDYGTSEDKIALITCDDYRKYRSLIPMINGWWWTITPWSCNPSYSYFVRGVNSSGALDSGNAYYGHYGVRPLCNLKSDIKVLCEDATEKESNITKLIEKWATDRGIDKNENSQAQMVKLMEEVGELAEGISKDKKDLIIDSIGDVYVVLTILSMQLGFDIETCIYMAYQEIKDRKGRMVNGLFVKEEDLEE